jgi:hypothetical protein
VAQKGILLPTIHCESGAENPRKEIGDFTMKPTLFTAASVGVTSALFRRVNDLVFVSIVLLWVLKATGNW